MRRVSRGLIVAAAVAAMTGAARAQEGGLDILDGETLWEGGWHPSVSELYRTKSLYSGTRRADDPQNQSYWESRTTVSVLYGLLPEVTLAGLLPFVHTNLRFDGPSGRESETADGIGNFTFIAKWRFFKQDWELASFNWAAFVGLETPTGRTGVTDDGVLLPPEQQPGAGAWSPLLATAATLDIYRLKLNASLLYKRNGRGDQDYKFGDSIVGDFNIGYRVIVEKYPGPLLRLQADFEWRHDFADMQGNDRVADSGGDTLLVKPAAVFWPTPPLGFVLEFEIPLYRNLRGTQLGENIGVSLTVSFRW